MHATHSGFMRARNIAENNKEFFKDIAAPTLK